PPSPYPLPLGPPRRRGSGGGRARSSTPPNRSLLPWRPPPPGARRPPPAEAIDAARAIAVTGFSDRQLFKDALCATLAKSADEVTRFDEVFDAFFDRDRVTLPDEVQSQGG